MPGERDTLFLGALPSLDEMGGISAEMRVAGAVIIDDFKDSLGQEELAAAVYIAMERRRQIQNKTDFEED